MAYVIKNTAGLINSKLTDAARKKISEGSFNISYFQVGDSEVCYDCISGADLSTGMVLDAEFNAQNLAPLPEKNKGHIKYPLYVNTQSTNTFGIPVKSPYIDEIYNTAAPLGFFTGNTGGTISWTAFTSSAYTVNPNFVADISSLSSGNTLVLSASVLNASVSGNVIPDQFVTLYFGNSGSVAPIAGNFPVLTYKVVSVTGNTSGNTGTVTIELDRDLPDFSSMSFSGDARALFYPTGMTALYDSTTPEFYWDQDAINFESNCDISQSFVKIWNMNIPWTENPAGLFDTINQGIEFFGSSGYCGTKEYLGYNSTGQTDSGGTYYYNSLSNKVDVEPKDQKAIAIVHYTNQAIDNFYGEKFALKPYDVNDPGATGQARNFKVSIPWLMWHKSTGATMGEIFYVDPPGFDSLNLFQVHHMESVPNLNMNNPGLRYYHLWDTNPNINGIPNRVGKVWPDLKIITFDDDEIVAALSNKSNRNWTLPAPDLGLVPPNTCDTSGNGVGLLSGSTDCLWLSYRFNNSAFTQSLHCNYYTQICGNNPDCPPDTADVRISFGNEFPFLQHDLSSGPSGFSANEMVLLVQKVTGDTRPDPSQWLEIDVTNQISGGSINNQITSSGITGTNILLTHDMYTGATTTYRLDNYINLPVLNQTGVTLNFGDEYYFYGNIESDIQATIYVMNYLCNLGDKQFMTSSNPTWSTSQNPYVTEVGLYDSNKDLMIISKIQSPEKRQGIQQYSIKIDM